MLEIYFDSRVGWGEIQLCSIRDRWVKTQPTHCEVCGQTTQRVLSSILPAALLNDSTPDETSVSIESAPVRKGLTISSAEACEKHMTISTISVILSKFRRKAVSPSAAVLPVSRRVRLFPANRFCGSCGSGKQRRPDC